MRVVTLFVALSAVATVRAPAFLGDSVAQTGARYGLPVAATGQPGQQTSTRTYEASGLQITCGYVGGKVEMESYSRDDRVFNSAEVEALLRSNGSKSARWTVPADGYVDGDYTRADGATAHLAGTKLTIQTPKWDKALAGDESRAKAAAASSSAGGSTNAASVVPSPAATNAAP
jgi:hypothetical protein